jgi:cell wall-associated NlpC family hydrolase
MSSVRRSRRRAIGREIDPASSARTIWREILTKRVLTKALRGSSDTGVMRRICLVLGALALLSPPATLAESPSQLVPAPSWAEEQIGAVVAAGAMAPSVASFRPDDPITRAELYDAIVAVGLPVSAPTDPDRLVTIRELDARLVASLGLLKTSRSIRLAAHDAGLGPPDLLGTETVARLLGLRINHPQGQELLELLPKQPATRAEVAYSLARALTLTEFQRSELARVTAGFAFPALTDWQRLVLGRAVRFVGHPYVWAGMSERPQVLYYGPAPGGFDCSGFVWRVYKLEPFSGAPLLGGLIRGRTTYSMSAEMRKADRIPLLSLEPGDIVFFGARGTLSVPQDVNHMGIYAGNGWFVHASGNGVTLQPLQGWYLQRFSWGRRPLAEAGLV